MELSHTAFMSADPLEERKNSPVPRLVHKYRSKAIIIASDNCFAYCRHCTRKNTVINGNGEITAGQIAEIIKYLEKTPQINDVLITGGDPLTLCDGALEYLVSRIRSVAHIFTIRIGTRAFLSFPARITEALADMLAKYHPVWVNTQFNHPCEITESAKAACEKFLNRGIPLGNQSVLMKGINDSYGVMEELLLSLIKIRVRPYYLYQCDLVRGTEHFATDYTLGMDLIENLRETVPGYGIPRFIVDSADGKIVAEHSNIISQENGKLLLKRPVRTGSGGEEFENRADV
jgi:lysine 2,3-aminomutase